MKPIEYLYLDNFRGFSNTLIPFRQVTFLLGENSSAKSPVLSMLNLVRNFSFWSEADFDTDNQHLGGFGDLVTEGSGAKTFTIGSARYTTSFYEKNETKIPFATFATYENAEGLPRLTNITYYVNGLAVQTFVESEIVYNRMLDLSTSNAAGDLKEDIISRLQTGISIR